MNLLKKNSAFLLQDSTHSPCISNVLKEKLLLYLNSPTDLILPEILTEISNETGWLIDTLIHEDISIQSLVPNSIKMLVFDVDGVMTDAGMYYSESGDEFKKFNARDGLAIRDLNKSGWITGIISHGINTNLIKRRADLLGIQHVYAGNKPKTDVLADWCNQLGLNFSQIGYIGDDINDLPIIRIVGFSACPSDAVNEVKKEVSLVLTAKGGEGAIREWIDRCFSKSVTNE